MNNDLCESVNIYFSLKDILPLIKYDPYKIKSLIKNIFKIKFHSFDDVYIIGEENESKRSRREVEYTLPLKSVSKMFFFKREISQKMEQ